MKMKKKLIQTNDCTKCAVVRADFEAEKNRNQVLMDVITQAYRTLMPPKVNAMQARLILQTLAKR